MVGNKLNVPQMLGIGLIALLACPFLADAQSFPSLKPIHRPKGALARAMTPADPSSPWQRPATNLHCLIMLIAVLAARFCSPTVRLCCKMLAAKIGGN